MCAPVRAAGQAEDGAPRIGVPVWSAQTGKCGNEVDAAVVGDAGREPLDLRRGADDAQPVAQPLHGRAGNEDTSLERVIGALATLPRHGGQQVVARRDRDLSGIEQHEAAGAIGVLGQPRLEASLTEQRRLLVAGDAGHRHGRALNRRLVAQTPDEGTTRGQYGTRNVEQRKQFVIPVAPVNVVQQRAAGVGGDR